MSKYAIEAFSDALRQEMKDWKVSVHIIEPGFFKTGMECSNEKSWTQIWDRQSDEMKEAYGRDYYQNGKISIVF